MPAPPLEGLRVLDHGHVWAGPLVGLMFAEMGADVITVEAPARLSGVDMGGISAAAVLGGAANPTVDNPLSYHGLARDKRSVTIDLGHEAGKALYKRLVAESDVIVENFAPAVMPRLGLGYEVLREVNPGIVMAALSAAGATEGPWRDLVTYGPSLGALYGLKSVQGYLDNPHPREDRADLDPTAAGHAFFAILAALEHRDRSGEGQFLDIAQGECAVQRLAEPLMDYFLNGRVASTQGNASPQLAPHGIYRAAGDDDWISIVVRDESEWAALLDLAGDEAGALRQEGFAEVAGRLAAREELDAAVEAWTSGTDAMELTELLQAVGVPAFPVMGPPELAADETYRAIQMAGSVVETPGGFGASEIYQGVVWKLEKTPGRINAPSAVTGQDNAAVFGDLLGLSEAELAELAEARVI